MKEEESFQEMTLEQLDIHRQKKKKKKKAAAITGLPSNSLPVEK